MNLDRPKVLHIHFGRDGGAERFFTSLAQALGERGVDQRFIIRPNRVWRGEIEGLGRLVERHHRPYSPLSLLLKQRLSFLVREWRPDAIMAWMPRAALLIPDCPGAVKITRLGDFPIKLKYFARCDVLVGNSPGISDRCKSLGWTGPVHTITNFPPHVTPRPVNRSELNTPEDVFLISGAARFVPRKRVDLLIRAAARIPEAWLWLLGDGQERSTLEALVHEVGMANRTRFTGWVHEPIHHIAATDVFAMPSRHEPLGNVILEAWQAGVPVVATRSEGPSWYMSDEEDGLLVDIDDLDGFVEALNRLRNGPSLANALVVGGRKRLEETFSRDRIVDQYMELFTGNLAP